MDNYLDIWKLLAGLGLFLFSMHLLEHALRDLAGNRFRRFLRDTTDNPVGAAFGGVVATAIVQSSSLVGLIVLAFVGAGIIPLTNAIGIVIGSNLGTTFTGWIVAILGFKVDLSALVLPLVAIGGLSYSLTRNNARAASQVVLSIALLIMGLDFMKDSTDLLTELVDVKALADLPLIAYLLIGVVFSAIIQSSSATMMLTLSALYAGIIPLPSAAALVIGADLGTTSTILLGSIQGAATKRQLAMAHVLFNLAVDVVAFIFLYPLLSLIETLNISDPLFALVAFHNLFNLIGLLVFLPLIRPFSAILRRLIRGDPELLQKYILNVPATETEAAMHALRREAKHLLHMVIKFNLMTLRRKVESASEDLEKIHSPSASTPEMLKRYVDIKSLEGEIVNYALKIHTTGDEAATQQIHRLIVAARAAVYSAKALKDISSDLEGFRAMESDIYETIRGYEDVIAMIYAAIYKLLKNMDRAGLTAEDISELRDDTQRIYDEFTDEIYQLCGLMEMDATDLSSLLNINKETHTSLKASIKSLSRLSLEPVTDTGTMPITT